MPEENQFSANPIVDRLANAFNTSGSQVDTNSQVDNSKTADDDVAGKAADTGTDTSKEDQGTAQKEESKATDDSKANESDKSESDDKEDGDTDKDADTDADTSDDDDTEPELDFPTAEQLKERYPRHVPNKYIAETAKYVELAKEGQEVIEKIGGDAFIEPMSKMATAIQEIEGSDDEESVQPFFQGLIEAGTSQTFAKVCVSAVQLAFVRSDEWAKNPQTHDLGKFFQETADAAVKAKTGLTFEEINILAEYKALGWMDKIAEWIENKMVPEDEIDELLESSSNPKAIKLAKENAALKSQLSEKNKASENGHNKNSEEDGTFSELVNERVDQALEGVAWKNSPLADREGDTPEMKQRKSSFRTILKKAAIEEFHKNPDRKALQQDFRAGKYGSATFSTKFTKVLASVLDKTKPETAEFEQTLAQLYGKTRNAQLKPKAKESDKTQSDATKPEEKKAPTEQTNFNPQAGKTRAEVNRDVTKNLAEALGAVHADRFNR